MKCFKVIGRLAAFALLLVSASGRAEVVTFNFLAWGGGSGYYADPSGPDAYLPEYTPIEGSFFYDTSLPANAFSMPFNIAYAEYDSATGIGVSASSPTGFNYTSSGESIITVTKYPTPSYPDSLDELWIGTSSPILNNRYFESVQIIFNPEPGIDAIAGTQLPTFLPLSNYLAAYVIVELRDTDGNMYFHYTAPIVSLEGSVLPGSGGDVSPVPEPESYAMLMAGLALLGVAVRRSKNKAAA